MPINTARNPFVIFQTSMKNGMNVKEEYILYRAVVREIDLKGGLYNNGVSPLNSIKAFIYKPQIDANDSGFTVLWPMDDYDTKPIAPMEHVFAIFEKSSLDYGFYFGRIPNKDKSYVSADEDITQNTSNTSAAEAFGVASDSQSSITINDIVSSQEDLQNIINQYKSKLKKRIEFEKRVQDHVLSCKNTGRIVIGGDRRDSVSSGFEDGEAIDCVVGVKKENGDPDFENDSTRTYMSSKSNPIDGLGNQDQEAIWYVKSDNDALIARKDILIESKDGGSKIKFNRDGSVELIGNTKITVKAPEIVCDGPKTTIGGTVGKKILTTDQGTMIGIKLAAGATALSEVTIAAGAALEPLGAATATVLKQLIQAIVEATNSDAV
jgi:hypothetical protein